MGELSLELSSQMPRLKMASPHMGTVFSMKGCELKTLHRTGGKRLSIFAATALGATLAEAGGGGGAQNGKGFAILFKIDLNPGLGLDRERSSVHPLSVAEVPCLSISS